VNNHFAENIAKEDIQALPLVTFEGDIHTVNSEKECDKIIKHLRTFSALGFDTEKKPAFVKGEYNHTAMVQLSTEDEAFLFRLNVMGYPKSLFDFMSDPSTLKLGISIDDDLKDLNKARKFSPSNFTDLNNETRKIGIKDIGVRKLAAIILDARISKNQQVSNWEAENLTESQQRYAATDAWVCLAIHNELTRRGFLNGQ